jgi:hypothetical protein
MGSWLKVAQCDLKIAWIDLRIVGLRARIRWSRARIWFWTKVAELAKRFLDRLEEED